MAARLTKMKYDEVSFVRRGANQHADVVLFKMDTDEEIEVEDEIAKVKCPHTNMATGDAECPDCGAKQEPHMDNPGKGKTVVHKAKELFGGKKAKPFGEKKGDPADDEEPDDDEDDPLGGQTYVRKPKAGVAKSLQDDGDNQEKPMLKSELPEDIAKHIEGDDDTEITTEVLQEAFAKATTPEPLPVVELDPLTKAMEEHPEVREAIQKAQAEAEAALEIAKSERDRRETSEYIAKASEFDALPIEAEKLGPVLKRLHESSVEDYAAVTEVLKSASAAASMLYRSVGIDAPSHMEGQSLSAIEKAAAEIRKNQPDLSDEQAYDAALIANPSLYAATLED